MLQQRQVLEETSFAIMSYHSNALCCSEENLTSIPRWLHAYCTCQLHIIYYIQARRYIKKYRGKTETFSVSFSCFFFFIMLLSQELLL